MRLLPWKKKEKKDRVLCRMQECDSGAYSPGICEQMDQEAAVRTAVNTSQ